MSINQIQERDAQRRRASLLNVEMTHPKMIEEEYDDEKNEIMFMEFDSNDN